MDYRIRKGTMCVYEYIVLWEVIDYKFTWLPSLHAPLLANEVAAASLYNHVHLLVFEPNPLIALQ